MTFWRRISSQIEMVPSSMRAMLVSRRVFLAYVILKLVKAVQIRILVNGNHDRSSVNAMLRLPKSICKSFMILWRYDGFPTKLITWNIRIRFVSHQGVNNITTVHSCLKTLVFETIVLSLSFSKPFANIVYIVTSVKSVTEFNEVIALSM